MRIAPTAIYAHLTEMNSHETAMLAYQIARLTHGHPLATFPAVSCVEELSSILAGEETVPNFSGSGLHCGEAVLKNPVSKIAGYDLRPGV
jgi:ADP-ribosylglycohydrolase